MCKNVFIMLVFFSVAAIFFSCNTDNEIDENTIYNDEAAVIVRINGIQFIECDQDKIKSFSGTICCISGPLEVSANATIQFTYSNNLNEPDVIWEVLSGKLALQETTNSTTAIFEVEEGFVGGAIRAWGVSNDKRECSEIVEISLIK